MSLKSRGLYPYTMNPYMVYEPVRVHCVFRGGVWIWGLTFQSRDFWMWGFASSGGLAAGRVRGVRLQKTLNRN